MSEKHPFYLASFFPVAVFFFFFLTTSQVFDEVLQLHLPLGLHVGTVHVSVEQNDGERQDKDGVGVAELPHHGGVADAVALAAKTEEEEKKQNKRRTWFNITGLRTIVRRLQAKRKRRACFLLENRSGARSASLYKTPLCPAGVLLHHKVTV